MSVTLRSKPLRQARDAPSRLYPLLIGLAMTGGGWTVLWGLESPWNPLAFTVLWTGAALAMWGMSREGYPSVPRHLALAGLSVPLWWWFELVNARVGNWDYVQVHAYSPFLYALLSSLAFSTVVPALAAAASFVSRFAPRGDVQATPLSHRLAALQITLGILLQAALFAVPTLLYPFVWVAPFLIADGLVATAGGPSLVAALWRRQWREPVVIGAAGLLCGILWELWNSQASPRWVYQVPILDFARLFEMPALGYGGYIPFAWFIAQLVRWLDALRAKAPAKASLRYPAHGEPVEP